MYYIVRHDKRLRIHRRPRLVDCTLAAENTRSGVVLGYRINEPFGNLAAAINAIRAIRQVSPDAIMLGVVNDAGSLFWSEEDGWPVEPSTIRSVSPVFPDLLPQEETVSVELQPLHVKRQDLVDKLQANLEDESAKRQEAASAISARRKKAEDAMAGFTGDELVNLVLKHGIAASLEDIPAMVEDAQENKRLVSPEVKPSAKESDLEKTVRILSMATDDTIEVQPHTDLWNLL